VLDPHLGGDEQLVAGDATLGDRATDGFLVAVGGGGVDGPVASGEGVGDDLLGLFIGTWNTPKPSIGIRTPLLRVIRRFCVDTVASFVG
jgi:hypothetical protein